MMTEVQWADPAYPQWWQDDLKTPQNKQKEKGKNTSTLDPERLAKNIQRGNTSTRSLARKKLAILQYYNNQCANCSSTEELTIDHIRVPNGKTPRQQSTFTIKNCQVLCFKCHVEKNKKGIKVIMY